MVLNLFNELIDPDIVKLIDSEGDFEEWIDEYSGYKCRINRVRSYGNWNGYVRLPDNSTLGQGPPSRLSYDNIDVEIHGGLTWLDKFPVPEMDDNGIWAGFDCAHAGDWRPCDVPKYGFETYRTKEYVKEEVKSLAKQLKDMEGC